MAFKSEIKSLIKKYIPAPWFHQAKKIRDHLVELNLGPPVVQIYVNTDGITTRLGINDFFNFLVRDVESEIEFCMVLYTPEGKKLYTHQELLKRDANFDLNVSQFLANHQLKSPCGLVTVQLKPKRGRHFEYKRLGVTGAHFYVFYEHTEGEAKGSIGHVHPSSVLDRENCVSGAFTSNQTIFTRDLEGIRLLQANPSYHPVEVTYHLLDIYTKKPVMSRTELLGPLTTHIFDFDFSDLPPDLQITVYLDKLPTANSKPVLIRKSKNKIWTYSHS